MGVAMENAHSRVTIHMAASLDGFIARRDGRVDWMETSDHFEGGEALAPESVTAFLRTIDCYVMGSRTYETALAFEALPRPNPSSGDVHFRWSVRARRTR
jgi:dihydrofolate reductase